MKFCKTEMMRQYPQIDWPATQPYHFFHKSPINFVKLSPIRPITAE